MTNTTSKTDTDSGNRTVNKLIDFFTPNVEIVTITDEIESAHIEKIKVTIPQGFAQGIGKIEISLIEDGYTELSHFVLSDGSYNKEIEPTEVGITKYRISRQPSEGDELLLINNGETSEGSLLDGDIVEKHDIYSLVIQVRDSDTDNHDEADPNPQQ